MANVVVHGPAASTYVWSVRVVLAEKGVPHELAAIPFGAQRLPEHMARQPFAKVPAFEHDGFALYETQAIVRYVDEAFPGPSLQPEDPRQRARMNQIIGILDAYGWPSLAGGIMFNRLIAPRIGVPCDEAAVEASVPKARVCVAEWARLMGDDPFLVGDRFTLADVMLAPLMIYTRFTAETQMLIGEQPSLAAWIGRMRTRPSIVTTAPPLAAGMDD